MNKFQNEYEMTDERYLKYMLPIFYKEKSFIIYVVVSVLAFIAFIYLDFVVHNYKMGLFALSLIFISVYITMFRKYITVNRQYKIIKHNELNDKPWMCKYNISNDGIDIYVNREKNNYIPWGRIKKWTEAKSYIALRWGQYLDAIILDKASFVEGTLDEFKDYMKREHDDIPFENEDPAFDR